MDTIVGTELWLKADRRKTYVVDNVNRVKKKVHMSPTHEGGGRLWKKMSNLWRDYERVRAMVTGDNMGVAPDKKEVVKVEGPNERAKVPDKGMSEEDMARWLNEG